MFDQKISEKEGFPEPKTDHSPETEGQLTAELERQREERDEEKREEDRLALVARIELLSRSIDEKLGEQSDGSALSTGETEEIKGLRERLAWVWSPLVFVISDYSEIDESTIARAGHEFALIEQLYYAKFPQNSSEHAQLTEEDARENIGFLKRIIAAILRWWRSWSLGSSSQAVSAAHQSSSTAPVSAVASFDEADSEDHRPLVDDADVEMLSSDPSGSKSDSAMVSEPTLAAHAIFATEEQLKSEENEPEESALSSDGDEKSTEFKNEKWYDLLQLELEEAASGSLDNPYTEWSDQIGSLLAELNSFRQALQSLQQSADTGTTKVSEVSLLCSQLDAMESSLEAIQYDKDQLLRWHRGDQPEEATLPLKTQVAAAEQLVKQISVEHPSMKDSGQLPKLENWLRTKFPDFKPDDSEEKKPESSQRLPRWAKSSKEAENELPDHTHHTP